MDMHHRQAVLGNKAVIPPAHRRMNNNKAVYLILTDQPDDIARSAPGTVQESTTRWCRANGASR